jgi:exonuclease SbcD
VEKLISLLKKRKNFSVQLNMLIGKELTRLISDSSSGKVLHTIISICSALSKQSVFVYPSFLLDCYVGYNNLKNIQTKNINMETWNNAISHVEEYLKDPEDIKTFIDIEMSMLESLGNKNEDRIARLKQLMGKINSPTSNEFKIVHTADLHFENDDLLQETIKSAEFIISNAKEINPDLTVIAGDLVHSRQTHDSPALIEAASFVRKLTEICPVFIIQGTRNHDGNNLKILDSLKTVNELYISAVPEYIGFKNGRFLPNPSNPELSDLLILSLPLTMGITNKHVISKTLQMFKDLKKPRFSILVSHGTVRGAVNSSDYIFSEADYSLEELKQTGATLCLLGHIHKAQHIDNIYYSGSIVRRTIDETEDKGFFVHILKEHSSESRFIKIPTRQVQKIEISSLEEIDVLNKINPSQGDMVKVVIKLKENQPSNLIEYKVHEILQKYKDIEIKIEKSIIPEHKVRIQGISKIPSLIEKCIKTAELLNIPISDSLLEKITLVQNFSEDDLINPLDKQENQLSPIN